MTLARRQRTSAWFCLVLAAILLQACSTPESVTELDGQTMGTSWRVVYGSTGRPTGGERTRIEALLEEINQSLSTYLQSSLVSVINRSSDPTDLHPIDLHFQRVFTRSLAVYDDTDGAFNPAVGPLVDAWGFGPNPTAGPPDPGTIDDLLQLIAFDRFEIRGSPPGLRKQMPQARLDFSAIAKGYGVDAVSDLIGSWGVGAFFVEIGGEVRTSGRHPEGRPWRIGIEKPAPDALAESQIQIVLELEDAAVATSGTYRNYTILEGRRLAHIINPRTGYPEESGLLSVTVLAEDAMTADAYATALMVMGPDFGLRFVESRPGLEAYFIGTNPEGVLFELRSSGFPEPVG